MDGTQALQRRQERRAGVIRRALRREATRIREPKRVLAMGILIVAFALAIAGMAARGETAGADAQAYWAAVRIWLEGGDPYHPTGPFLPYVYAPWMLPLFIPWALLPWDVAWFVWRGGTILLLLWSIRWAYTQRPLATAVLVGLLAFPLAANLDTGNINLLLALALFGAHFTGPRVGGLIWGLATWMKWVPVPAVADAAGAIPPVGPRVPRAARRCCRSRCCRSRSSSSRCCSGSGRGRCAPITWCSSGRRCRGGGGSRTRSRSSGRAGGWASAHGSSPRRDAGRGRSGRAGGDGAGRADLPGARTAAASLGLDPRLEPDAEASARPEPAPDSRPRQPTAAAPDGGRFRRGSTTRRSATPATTNATAPSRNTTRGLASS